MTFLDFPDFFNLIKDSIPQRLSNETIFADLTWRLYDLGNVGLTSFKDDVSDICRKKKAFSPKVREVATLQNIDLVRESIQAPLMENIIQLDILIDKLLFLVQKDSVFFTSNDYALLKEHAAEYDYVLAYILIRTIATSPESRKLKHTDNYNPFADYTFPYYEVSTPTESNVIKEIFIQTSKYLMSEHINAQDSMPAFNSSLLSNGINYSTYRNDFNLQDSFFITTDSSKAKPLTDYLKNASHLLVTGEGGIGKTTFLYSCLKNYHEQHSYPSIPLYVRLADCPTCTDHRHMILDNIYRSISFAIKGNSAISFRDLEEEFKKECEPDKMPEYTLLLDGFNEVTAMDYGEVRSSIIKEITRLLSYSNVRIILTTRDVDLLGLPKYRFLNVRANGIRTEDVENYLKTKFTSERVKTVVENPTLMQYLRIPLFLIMYSYSTTADQELPQNRGAILFQYFNGSHSFYNEKSNAEEKNNRETSLLINVLLDFLLPTLGFYMKSNNSFFISEDHFEKLVYECMDDSNRFISLHAAPYERYEKGPTSLRRILRTFSQLDYEDILILLRDCLCVIICDSNRNIYFAHQYIRDYFSSLYFIREIYYMNLLKQKDESKLFDYTYEWGNRLFDNEDIDLIKDILSVPSEYRMDNMIYCTLELFRSNQTYRLKESLYGVSNLINLLATLEQGNLFLYDFDHLNLKNTNLTNYNFYDIQNKRSSSFAASTIGKDTFAAPEHNREVIKWSVSDDGRFVISFSKELEIKVWNIATRKCLFTRLVSSFEAISEVNNLELYHNGTLAFFSCCNRKGELFLTATYDFLTDSYTKYDKDIYGSTNHYVFYDARNDHIFAINYYGGIYEYELENPISIRRYPCLANLVTSKSLGCLTNIPALAQKCYMQLLDSKQLFFVDTIKFKHDTRYIQCYILNLTNQTQHLMKADENDDELIKLPIDKNSILTNTFAISKNKKRIIMSDRTNIYLYDIGTQNYTFRIIYTFKNHYICFCHDDPDILTIYGDQLIQLNIATDDIMFKKTDFKEFFFWDQMITPTHLIYGGYPSFIGSTPLSIEEHYSGSFHNLELSFNEMLIKTYLNEQEDTLYSIYNNGTVMCMDTQDLSICSCYNYSHGIPVTYTAYSRNKNRLCLICEEPTNSLWHQYTVVIIELNTNKHIAFQLDCYNLLMVHFIDDTPYMIGVGGNELVIIDTNTQTVVKTYPAFGTNMTYPRNMFPYNNDIHIICSCNATIDNTLYHGIDLSYRFDAEAIELELLESTYISDLITTDTPDELPAMYIYPINEQGFLRVKNMQEESDWRFAYHQTKTGQGFTPRENDCFIPFPMNPYTELDEFINIPNITSALEGFQKSSSGYLCFSMKQHAFYVIYDTFLSIWKKTLGTKGTIESGTLLPHSLLYNCDFSNCMGYMGDIPEFVKNRPVEELDEDIWDDIDDWWKMKKREEMKKIYPF